MREQERFEHSDLGDQISSINAVMNAQIYLIKGGKAALLVDTGMGLGFLREYIKTLTPLPLIVVNTHGHPDHAGGNGEFEEVYQHPGDLEIYTKTCASSHRREDIELLYGSAFARRRSPFVPFANNIKPLQDEQVFDLGGRMIEVIHIPGHTPGSVCLYDSMTGTLFTGDSVVGFDCWLFLEHAAPLETYCKSLEKLKNPNRKIVSVCPGHLPFPIMPEVIDDFIGTARRILSGEVQGIPCRTFAGSGLRYQFKAGGIIYDPGNLYEHK